MPAFRDRLQVLSATILLLAQPALPQSPKRDMIPARPILK